MNPFWGAYFSDGWRKTHHHPGRMKPTFRGTISSSLKTRWGRLEPGKALLMNQRCQREQISWGMMELSPFLIYKLCSFCTAGALKMYFCFFRLILKIGPWKWRSCCGDNVTFDVLLENGLERYAGCCTLQWPNKKWSFIVYPCVMLSRCTWRRAFEFLRLEYW